MFSKKFITILILTCLIFFQLLNLHENVNVKQVTKTYFSKESPLKPILIPIVDPEINKHSLELLKDDSIMEENLNTKCIKYFETILKNNKDYQFEIFNDEFKDWLKQLFEDKENYINKQVELSKKNDPDFKIDENFKLSLELKYLNEYKKFNDYENKMIQSIKDTTIFEKCFLTDDNSLYHEFSEKNPNAKLEDKIFPWISRNLPVFTRWTGYKTNQLPDFTNIKDEDLEFEQINTNLFKKSMKNYRIGNNQSFFNYYYNHINSKGIIISSANQFIDDTVNLIKGLRNVGNQLPIQIMHTGDLSIENQLKIIKIARTDKIYYPQDLHNKLKELNYLDLEDSFPKQEVWFVNVENCIDENFTKYFKSYMNKLLGYLLTSFDEVLLMDTDTVPFVSPNYFFNTTQYLKSNSIFYKDRSIPEKLAPHDVEFFLKMMPNKLDETLFELQPVTNKTLSNRFFQKFKHLMESGIVAQKRSSYWLGLPMMIQLYLLTPVKERVWGDKELFWLAQSVVGNENYEFNDYHVASVGELKKNTDIRSQRICSTHPSHISSDDNKLVWINSGIKVCKNRNVYEKDFATNGYYQTKESFINMYKSPVKLTHAIIPPDGGVKATNMINEPENSWESSNYCGGYFWCAYSSIGSGTLPEYQGKLITFSDEQVVWHDYVASVYHNDWEN